MALAEPVLAQATPSPSAEIDEVVVTGTRLANRTVTNSPVPIDVLTHEELTRSGHSGTARVLQTLIPSFNYPTPTTPDGNTHIRSASLRGLSPDQTLVLGPHSDREPLPITPRR